MNSELNTRLRRIYTALDAVSEAGVRDVPVSSEETQDYRFIEVDFRQGLTDEELSNRIHGVIHNIANLKGHLIRWARVHEVAPSIVCDFVGNSADLKIVIDLSNNDKHGYPPRNGGYTGLSPRIKNLERGLRLTTRPELGSSVGFVIGSDGIGRVTGEGSAELVITGEIVDSNGAVIGDLETVLQRAILAWERFWKQYAT